MKVNRKLAATAVIAATFAAGAFAQQGMDYFHRNHPNIEMAQREAAQAAEHIKAAQVNNEFDFGGHAMNAREHLSEANKQLNLAQEYIRQHPEKEKK